MNWYILLKAIAKQNIERAEWLLLTACSKMRAERNDLEAEFIIRRETEWKEFEKSAALTVEQVKRRLMGQQTEVVHQLSLSGDCG